MTEKEIQESYCRAMCDEDYNNFFSNEMLYEGKSNLLFQDNIKNRIKVAYYGRMCGDNLITGYSYNEGKINHIQTNYNKYFAENINDLICSNDLHRVSTNIFTDLAFNEFNWNISTEDNQSQEAAEEFLERHEIEQLLKDSAKLIDYSGSLLAKIIEEDDMYSIDYVTNQNYFPVFSTYNTRKVKGYIEYSLVEKECELIDKEKLYFVTVHEEFSTSRYFAKRHDEKGFIMLSDQESLITKYGYEDVEMESTHDTWLVQEVYKEKARGKVFGSSNYSYASKSALIDWTAIATVETQNIDSIMKVKYVVSNEFVEMTNEDNPKPYINQAQDYFVALQGGEKPLFEQIKNEFDYQGNKSAKEQKEEIIYKSLGVNETATGTTEKGYNSISGKMIDMTTPISKAKSLFKAIKKYEKLINTLLRLEGNNFEINFTMGSPLTLTDKEKIENYALMVDNAFISNTEAIAELRNKTIEEAKKVYDIAVEEQQGRIIPVFQEEEI